MVMTASRRERKQDTLAQEIRSLTGQIADLQAEIKRLSKVRDDTAERNQLKDEIETLKREKDRLTEIHDREIRETEHKVGLVRQQQEQDVAHAKRMAVLEVREGNLDAAQKRFEDQMRFQQEQFDQRVTEHNKLLEGLMERLPVIDVALSGGAGTKRTSRRGRGDED